MEQKMVQAINKKIEIAVRHFNSNGGKWDDTHKYNMAEIEGAIDMLSILTGRSYFVAEDGLHEVGTRYDH